jgi:hypothetical protein
MPGASVCSNEIIYRHYWAMLECAGKLLTSVLQAVSAFARRGVKKREVIWLL